MSARDTVAELLERIPFEPFRVVTSTGESYIVRHASLVALLKSEVFIAQPNSDRRATVPWLHVTAVELLPNGAKSRSRRKRKK